MLPLTPIPRDTVPLLYFAPTSTVCRVLYLGCACSSLCHHVRRARCNHGRMHCACCVSISLKLVSYHVECALPDGEPRALFSLSLQTPPTPYSSTTSHKVMTRSLSQRPVDTRRSSALPSSSFFFRVYGSRFQLSTRDPGYPPESPSLATGCFGERDRKFYTVSEPGTPGLSDQEFSLENAFP